MSDKYNEEKIRKILESEKVPKHLEPESIKDFLDNTNAQKRRSNIKRDKILRRVSVVAAAAVLCTTTVNVMTSYNTNDKTNLEQVYKLPESMTAAANYDEVYKYFSSSYSSNVFGDIIQGIFSNDYKYSDNVVVLEESAAYAVDSEDIGAAESDGMTGGVVYEESNDTAIIENGDVQSASGTSETKKEYSDTYSQETGVLEADIVKTNGDTIFYSSDDTIYIADVEKGNFINSYKTDVSTVIGINSDGSIKDMYIYNDMLVTICSYNYDCYGDGNTYIVLFDISDTPKLIGYYMQEGNYNDVRMLENGYLYVISNNGKSIDYSETTKEDVEIFVPKYCVNEEEDYVEPEDIMIPSRKLDDCYDYVSYTTISGINLNADIPYEPVDMKSIAGYSNNVYCSQQSLYIASGYNETEITRFAICNGEIVPRASGKVNGYAKDQFSMSEYNGYFRIAVNEEVWEEDISTNTFIEEKNSVYVLDMDMNIVGSISDIGINESIKSVNFNGDIVYVVTFRQTDPLYAIDLKNPTAPVLLDEFKISGYSSYMQEWEEGMLFGFGMEADEFGIETGVKMTMFDNSNPDDLKAIDTEVFGDNEHEYYSSEGVYERKALYIDPERNIIGIPIERVSFEYDYGIRELTYYYKFYSFNNGEFVFKGEISKQMEDKCLDERFRRVVYIDGYLYAVSKDCFSAVDAQLFSETGRIEFN